MNVQDRKDFRSWLEKLGVSAVFVNPSKVLQTATDQWRRGNLTNFE